MKSIRIIPEKGKWSYKDSIIFPFASFKNLKEKKVSNCLKKNWTNSKTIGLFFILFAFSLISVPQVFAIGDVSWGTLDSPKLSYDIKRGGVEELIPQRVSFEIFDEALVGSDIDKVTVNITSSVDHTGIILTLDNENKDGTIQNNKTVLTRDSSIFHVGDTVKITYEMICAHTKVICNPDIVDEIDGVDLNTKAFSDSSFNSEKHESVPIHLIETGNNTEVFEGKLKLIDGPSVPGIFPEMSQLQVSTDDTITLRLSSFYSNGIILPVSEDKGAIAVEDGGTLSITYVSQDNVTHSHHLTIKDPKPGGFGGGPTNGGIVVDSSGSRDSSGSSSSGGGCSGDCGPPSLGVDQNYNRIVEDGFSFNGNPVDVKHFYTPYPLITVNVGEENIAILKIYEDGGVDSIAHVGLAFGLAKNEYFSDSKATIN
ncbi:MAG: hypothetical protein PVG23_01920, partial [Nitrosopumilaceae archaeon]